MRVFADLAEIGFRTKISTNYKIFFLHYSETAYEHYILLKRHSELMLTVNIQF